MTTTIERPVELWSTMPGWGIVANLTPPELIAARKLKTIRKALMASFALLLVIGMGLYALAFLSHRSAVSQLSQEQARTTQLIAEQHKYQRSVQVQSSIDGVRTELGSLLTYDIDQAALVAKIRAKLPANMTISQLTITVDAASGNTTPVAGAGSLDASGSTHIGSVTLAGNEQHIADVSAYVNALATLPGVVAPYPGSSTVTDKTVQWSAQLTLTSDLLTHRYDTAKKGSK